MVAATPTATAWFEDERGGMAPRGPDGTWLLGRALHSLVLPARPDGAAPLTLVDVSGLSKGRAPCMPFARITGPVRIPLDKAIASQSKQERGHDCMVHLALVEASSRATHVAWSCSAFVYDSAASVLERLANLFKVEPIAFWFQNASRRPSLAAGAAHLSVQLTSLELEPGPAAFRLVISHGHAAVLSVLPVVFIVDVLMDGELVSQANAWANDSVVDMHIDPHLCVLSSTAGTIAVRIAVGLAVSATHSKPCMVDVGGVVDQRLYVYTVL